MAAILAIMQFAVPLAYLGAAFFYARLFFSEEESRYQSRARAGTGLALFLHTLFLLALAVQFRRCPLATLGESLLFLGWILGAIHFLSERLAHSSRLGLFTLLPATLSILPAPFLVGHGLDLAEEHRNSFFVFHIVASLSSYACFSMAAVLASLYLVLHRRLKQKRFDLTFRKLPPLDKLDKLSAIWSVLGSITMVASSFIGWWWVRTDGLAGMSWSELGIYIVLAVFLAAGVSRRLFAFRGKRHAEVVLAGFAVLLVVNVFGVHGFGS